MRSLLFMIILGSTLLLGCKAKKTSFVYLDRLSGSFSLGYKIDGKRLTHQKYQYMEQSNSIGSKKVIPIYQFEEYILIEHPPTNIDSLQKTMLAYRDSIGKPLQQLGEGGVLYRMLFYRSSRNTRYFIENDEDPGGFSSYLISNYPKDFLGYFQSEKCYRDSTKWRTDLTIPLKSDQFGMLDTKRIELPNSCPKY